MVRKIEKARFQVWINGGTVTLELRDGQRLEHHTGRPTEEGWIRSSHVWEREGNTIYRYCDTQARDCDGRMDWSSEDVLDIANLQVNEEGFPIWDEVDSSQRDYTAEAMGY